MIIPILLYLAFTRGRDVEAFPLSTTDYSNDTGLLLYPRKSVTFSERSTYNIVWSCFSTIFACTWIAVHANISSPNDKPWQVLGRRIAITGYMLLAPEFVILWASRQYFGSLNIAKKHKDRGWTKTHAYFVIMGGFSLHQDGKFLRTLDIVELEELSAAGKIEWPTLTEVEIEDRSKGDALVKGIVVLQTLWFVTQCIARGVNNLVVTELEVVALAFATLTGLIYFLWWNKPLDVRCSVPVHASDKVQPKDELEDKVTPPEIPSPENENNTPVAEPPTDAPVPAVLSDVVHDNHPLEANNTSAITTTEPIPDDEPESDSPTEKLQKILKDKAARICVATGRACPPYSPDIGDTTEWEIPITIIVSIVFGGIHCIAWRFAFPTLVERWAWRATAVIVSALPFFIVMLSVVVPSVDAEAPDTWKATKVMHSFLVFLGISSTLPYIVARLVLLVLPLISLRSLPPRAYVDIQWSAFFPHFSS